jgi:hypothetical protein
VTDLYQLQHFYVLLVEFLRIFKIRVNSRKSAKILHLVQNAKVRSWLQDRLEIGYNGVPWEGDVYQKPRSDYN